MLAARKSPGALALPDRPGEARPDAAPGRRWHVCFVAPGAWPVFSGQTDIPYAGGAEVQQATLARLLAARGYRVSMICQDFGQPDGVEIDGVVVRKVFGGRDGVPLLRFVHPRLTTMWRALQEVDADIYYYRSAAMWVGVVGEFCRRRGKRLIYAGAADPDFVPDIGGQIRYARDRWLYRRGLRLADAIVVQNRLQLERARAHYGREAVPIPSCYVLPRAARSVERDRVLWVATLRRTKRPELFVELARRMPGCRFTMVGGPSADDPRLFARIAREAEALPNLEFIGFLPLAEVEKWFDRARVATERCKRLLQQRVDLVAPDAESTIVSFRVDGEAAAPLVERLREQGVAVRDIPGRGIVRVSCGWWTSDDDLDRLAAALEG